MNRSIQNRSAKIPNQIIQEMLVSHLSFKDFLTTAFDNGSYATDDIIAFIIPLMEEVLSFHEENKVAGFENENSLSVYDSCLDIDENHTHPRKINLNAILPLWSKIQSTQFTIIGEDKYDTDVDAGTIKIEDLQVKWNANEDFARAAYVRGYTSYEIILGHHDELTDIFCLGLVLASISLSLNFYEEEDLRTFVHHRKNPVQYNNRLHPTLGALITEMTELDRSKRAQDLYDIINRLQNYRDYDSEKQTDLSNTAGWINKELTQRSQFILQKLRNRLFDTSRRNRLLYYKPNMRFVNLTISSVPKVLHYQSIKPEHLFTWNKDVSGKIKGMKDIVLNKYLRFEDHVYLSSSLDKIRNEALKDIREFGFSQLKLVIAFLNWHNLKENSNERIQSPLLLLPVTLKRNKKLKEDHYVMSVEDNVAEVNPVVANFLKELYDIKLPEFVDLDEMSPEEFYHSIKVQIDNVNQGIVLNFIDKPRIKLMHSVARQTINNYSKRLRKNRNFSSYKDIDYSYTDENYKPLGLEIFRQRIEPSPSYLEFLINDDIQLSSYNLTGEDKQRTLYTITESENNPFSWDIDVCNMVLGNFNYKKMSLVRDYNAIIDENIQHQVFENLFSNEPKQYKNTSFDLNKPTDWYHVITADPTQTKAILESRSGESYVIQGPPGTGKSQTITNLIADFVARGKQVLFVCEKRAALDVVFARLKQKGLDELCCYIHDSQTDKRNFIKNLNATYDDFISKRLDLKMVETKRSVLLQQLIIELEKLNIFHLSNSENYSEAAISVRELIEKVVALKPHLVTVADNQDDLVPVYKEWMEFGNEIEQLSEALEYLGAEAAFAEHPFSKINDDLFLTDNPNSVIEQLAVHIRAALEQVNNVLNSAIVPAEYKGNMKQLSSLINEAVSLNLFATSDNLDLIDPRSEKTKQFEEQIKSLNKEQQTYQQFQEHNENWIHKFNKRDVEAALAIAERNEGSFFSFLNGSWRSLKKQINQNYDLSKHPVKPSYTSILVLLKQEYQTAKNVTALKNQIEHQYHLTDVDEALTELELVRKKQGNALTDYLVANNNTDLVIQLSRLNNTFHQLEMNLRQCMTNYEYHSVDEIQDDLENIMINIGSLKELLPALRAFNKLPYAFKKIIREIPLTPKQAQATIAHKTLELYYRAHRSFEKIDYFEINQTVQKIRSSYKQLLKLNADFIKASIRSNFLLNYELSNMATGQLNKEQRLLKKNYCEGRKILENEFSKSMRYKSIRELSAKESGIVLKDIKPVWLMSPLSVSDSLPVDQHFFDVVIFDEASQITLEQGVPALFRSSQTIIVGDDKQMPPTNFFTAKAEDPDDLEKFGNEEDDELLSNEADSILVQGARKLHSTMLSWHYRSKFETLISYSNHAFYDAGLLTIPDKTIHHTEKKQLEINKPEDAASSVNALFDRSLSFHYLPNSVYEKRSNISEAFYIANLVRALLTKNVQESIGIVAFSQEQQHVIEDALSVLASTDKKFEQDLEDAYNRVEDEQHVGLFVKNLENVQGDERDIIIMSVCYGFDAKKKMLMNFGPINKKGGEKRLNVIFSRAKKHMAVISSIKHTSITNDYNEGASYFKRFLQYAEAVSEGNMQLARTVLNGLIAQKQKNTVENQSDVIQLQVKEALQQKGYQVMENVGQSAFKCSLAVKAVSTDETYSLGILIDDLNHYENNNLLEQYFQRPEIMQTAGWKVMHVYAKDWLSDSGKVIETIIKKLSEKEEVEESINEVELIVTEKEISVEETNNPVAERNASGTPYDHLVFDRIVCINEQSNKFWEAAVDQAKLIIRFGKIGSKGQIQLKTFGSEQEAERAKLTILNTKKSQGYTTE